MEHSAGVSIPWVETVVQTSMTIGEKLRNLKAQAATNPELLKLVEQLIADNEANRGFAVQQACLHYSEIIQDLSPEEIDKIHKWNSSLPLYH